MKRFQLPAVHEAWLPRQHVLHRPRHGGKQAVALLCAVLFFATPTALWATDMRPGELENRELAGVPSMSDGWGFFTGWQAWGTDQLIFREGAVTAADWISRTAFAEPAPLGEDHGHGGPLPGDGDGTADTDIDADTEGERPQHDGAYRRVLEGDAGWLYFGEDIEGKCSPEKPIHETVGLLDELRGAVEDSGRNFELVIIPDKTTMVPEHLPESYPGEDCAAEATREFWPLVSTDAGALDLRFALAAAQQRMERPIYSREDTHWTDEGSIVLARTLADAIQPDISDTWELIPDGQHTASADLPPLIGQSGSRTTTRYQLRPDGVTDRRAELVTDASEATRLTSDPLEGTVDTRTFVLGDSFTETASVYLGAAFSDLTLLHYASLAGEHTTAIEQAAASEQVVVAAIEREVAAGTAGFLDAEFISELRAQLADQPVG